MYKLIAFDIDGTILPHGLEELPQENLKMIEDLKNNGFIVAFATGREWVTIGDLINTGGVEYFVGANGAFVNELKTQKEIHNNPLESSAWKELQEICDKLDIDYNIVTKESAYFKDVELMRGNWFWGSMIDIIKPIKDFVIGTEEILQITIRTKNEEESEVIKNFTNKHPKLEINTIWSDGMFIAAPGVNKASGLKKLCKHLNINMENVIAFGDGENDIEMLSEVGLGIAMGNAIYKAKAVAKEVCDTDTNFGPKKKLEELKLI